MRARSLASTSAFIVVSGSLFLMGACSSDVDSPPSSPSAGSSGSSSSSVAGSGGAAAGSSGATTGGAGGAAPTSGSAGVSGSGPSGGTANGGMAGATAVAGSAGMNSAGAGGGAESPPGFFTDGFLKRDPWQGYVFTLADKLGSTISPVCDTAGCTPAWGAQPCAKGTVAKNAMSASFAGLAFHTVDPMGGPRGVWLATGSGVFVSVINPPASARLQLQQKAASNDTRYCAPLPTGGTGLIPFADFKTYCWGDAANPSKPFAAGTDVHEVTVIIPGNSTADQTFDFCLADIQPR